MHPSNRLEKADPNLEELLGLLAGKPELTQRFAAIAKLASEPECNGRIRSADEVCFLSTQHYNLDQKRETQTVLATHG